MIGLAASFFFSVLVLILSLLNRKNFNALVKINLALLPQMPVVLFLHHNLDRSKLPEPAWMLMMPVFTSLFLLTMATIHFVRTNSHKVPSYRKLSPILIGYISYFLFCIISGFFGSDPSWSMYAILWTLPFGIIFFIAGSQTEFNTDGMPLSLSVITSCLISFAIVSFALKTGRANSLFDTRSFGSILSTTGILQMLIVYVPLASFEKRKSKIVNLAFWIFPPVLFALSLSRSASIPLLVYLFTFSKSFSLNWNYKFKKNELVLLGMMASFAILFFLFLTASGEVWIKRFEYLPYAIQTRLEKFGPYWESANVGNPFAGVGYGLTRFNHPDGFTDLHNLILTELYENGLGSAISLASVFIFAVIYAVRCLIKKRGVVIAFAILMTLLLAHAQGINLSIRNPTSYNTPYFLCALFFLFGILEKEFFASIIRSNAQKKH